jgi:hypothetical protein
MAQSTVDKIPTGPELDALQLKRFLADSSKKSGEKEWRLAKTSRHATKFLKLL